MAGLEGVSPLEDEDDGRFLMSRPTYTYRAMAAWWKPHQDIWFNSKPSTSTFLFGSNFSTVTKRQESNHDLILTILCLWVTVQREMLFLGCFNKVCKSKKDQTNWKLLKDWHGLFRSVIKQSVNNCLNKFLRWKLSVHRTEQCLDLWFKG